MREKPEQNYVYKYMFVARRLYAANSNEFRFIVSANILVHTSNTFE